jgi:hypothetical protein
MRAADRGVAALACGRLLLGAASILAPKRVVRGFGMAPNSELVYMTQVFGARAMALGAPWWLLRDGQRDVVQRLALVVDTSDTVAGLAQLREGAAPRRSAAALVALTGGYAMVGAARALRPAAAA